MLLLSLLLLLLWLLLLPELPTKESCILLHNSLSPRVSNAYSYSQSASTTDLATPQAQNPIIWYLEELKKPIACCSRFILSALVLGPFLILCPMNTGDLSHASASIFPRLWGTEVQGVSCKQQADHLLRLLHPGTSLPGCCNTLELLIIPPPSESPPLVNMPALWIWDLPGLHQPTTN